LASASSHLQCTRRRHRFPVPWHAAVMWPARQVSSHPCSSRWCASSNNFVPPQFLASKKVTRLRTRLVKPFVCGSSRAFFAASAFIRLVEPAAHDFPAVLFFHQGANCYNQSLAKRFVFQRKRNHTGEVLRRIRHQNSLS